MMQENGVQDTLKVKPPEHTKLLSRHGQLKDERASWISHWQEISESLLPRSGRFFVSDRNKGQKKHNRIYDNSAIHALSILGAGMMSGATSPARQWFRLGTSDPELNTYQPVKVWLDNVAKLMQHVFTKSNTYSTLHTMYEELGAFGTSATLVLHDFHNIIHHYPIPIGEYALAMDYKGKVNTLYREFQKTVGEIVGEFGYKNCSQSVQRLYDRGSLGEWITLIHAVEPRVDRDSSKRDALNMPFGSYYFEAGGNENKYLREGGFKYFPALVPRWKLQSGDIYGHSPAMECLGDIHQLQHEQYNKALGIDLANKMPLQVPPSLKNHEVDMFPGGITVADQSTGGIRPLYETRLDMNYLLMDIQDVRQRIRSSFYADLFLMLSQADNTRMTATEVAERHEEKLLMLGPVLERLHNELLSPLIDVTFAKMVEGEILPPPPQEIQGMDLSVEFISMLAQAQRAIGTNSIDRFVSSLGMVAQIKPEVMDKFDGDNWVDAYSDMLGVDPRLIVANDQVAMVRQQRAEAQEQQQQLEEEEQKANIAQKLAQSSTGEGGKNALMDVINQFSGYNSPSPLER
ncbi:portal protein [Bartonella sp. OT172YNZD]|uniref:portal protein n=1 Tax=Bartonella sp. OT172YNZD TaxID=3243572 RepID=UPI0035CFFE63